MVAVKLDKKLRENLWDARNNLFHGNTGQTGSFSFTRPMLIILDRNLDLAIPLHHTWTYQALAHDVLDLSLNRLVNYEYKTNKYYLLLNYCLLFYIYCHMLLWNNNIFICSYILLIFTGDFHNKICAYYYTGLRYFNLIFQQK